MPVYGVDRELKDSDQFEGLGRVVWGGRDLSAFPEKEEVEALFIRSVTPISAELLGLFPALRVVASATAGLDHVDLEGCAQHGISVVNAPGHNASAVADWVWTVLHSFARSEQVSLRGMRLGVVGAGCTGSAVATRASGYGMDVVLYDPPKAEREPGFQTATWQAILECDVISLHVPLTQPGENPWPTEGFVSTRSLNGFDGWLLNASRGSVMDWEEGPGKATKVGLDVFPGEPNVPTGLVESVSFATPHVAGNTHEAKAAATRVAAFQVHGILGTGAFDWTSSIPLSPAARDFYVERLAEVESLAGQVLDELTGLHRLSVRFLDAMRGDGGAEQFRSVRRTSRRHGLQGRKVFVEQDLPQRELGRLLELHGIVMVSMEEAELRVFGR